MRDLRKTVGVLSALALSATGSTLRAQTATQTVTFRVVGVNRAVVAGMTAPLDARPRSASVGRASYALSTNEASQKITASLDRSMPAGTALSVALTAPAGATSRGKTTLGTAATDVVMEIPAGVNGAQPLEYTMSGAPAGPLAAESRVVTYTIVAEP
jgi:hypothetical protein